MACKNAPGKSHAPEQVMWTTNKSQQFATMKMMKTSAALKAPHKQIRTYIYIYMDIKQERY